MTSGATKTIKLDTESGKTYNSDMHTQTSNVLNKKAMLVYQLDESYNMDVEQISIKTK